MWPADTHWCDQVPCSAEESRKTQAVTEGRGEAWPRAHRRPNSENARWRARRRASPMLSSQCTAATGEAVGQPSRWRHQRRSARFNCWRAGGSSPMNSRPNDELERTLVMKIDDEKEKGRPSQGTKHWPGGRDDLRENRRNRQGCRTEDQKTMVAALVGRHQKKRQRMPQACTASRAT